jgi:hypothetical protein
VTILCGVLQYSVKCFTEVIINIIIIIYSYNIFVLNEMIYLDYMDYGGLFKICLLNYYVLKPAFVML